MDLKGGGALGAFNSSTALFNNSFYNGTNYIYKASTSAAFYQMAGNVHQWYQAGSGTAGNAITFTQAMTLDASGNLLLNTTNTSQTAGVGIKLLISEGGNNQDVVVTNQNSTSANAALTVYSTAASAYRFYVTMDGKINCTSTTIAGISDIRFKENIRDLDAGLSEIMSLKPRLFDWKEGKGQDIKNARGFVAQEFEQVFPDLIGTWRDEQPEGEEPYKTVSQDLIPVLVKAMQEQQQMIETLQAEVAALKGA
jgi:hypothetical protein